MNIYILTIDGKPEQTTESLDHATLWKLKGKGYDYCEKTHYESEHLACYLEGDEIFIQTDENVAQVKPEFYYDEGFVGYTRIIIDFFNDAQKNLEDCNFTADFVKEIENEVEKLKELKQEESGRDEEFASWMNGHERI